MPVSYKPQGKIPPGILARALMGISELFGSDPHPNDQPYGLLARSILEAQPVRKPASIGPLSEEKEYSDRMAAMQRANPDTGLDPQGLAFQMFAGQLAKTANKAMLKKAQGMLNEGVDRAKIWADTGWFKDVDDKWKFEIDDSKSGLFLHGPKYGTQEFTDLSDAMKHKEAFSAYPEAKKIAVSWGNTLPGGASGRYYQSGPMEYMELAEKQEPQYKHKTMLHELQHSIQGQEGFAKGGSPQSAVKSLGYLPNPVVVDQAQILLWGVKEYGSVDEAIKHIRPIGADEWQTAAIDIVKKEPERVGKLRDILDQAADPYALYRRLAGEAEARNVETRMNFSPQERMARPPWTTLDVPEDQLIVRGLAERLRSGR